MIAYEGTVFDQPYPGLRHAVLDDPATVVATARAGRWKTRNAALCGTIGGRMRLFAIGPDAFGTGPKRFTIHGQTAACPRCVAAVRRGDRHPTNGA